LQAKSYGGGGPDAEIFCGWVNIKIYELDIYIENDITQSIKYKI